MIHYFYTSNGNIYNLQSSKACKALHSDNASISDSLISWRLYVTGQSMHVHEDIGASKIPWLVFVKAAFGVDFLFPFICMLNFSIAKDPELSRVPLQR